MTAYVVDAGGQRWTLPDPTAWRLPCGDAAAQVVLLPELEGVAHIVGPGLLLQPEGRGLLSLLKGGIR